MYEYVEMQLAYDLCSSILPARYADHTGPTWPRNVRKHVRSWQALEDASVVKYPLTATDWCWVLGAM